MSASFFLAFALAQEAENNASATVTLPSGATIVGTSNGGVDSFLGIQYGEVGERFSRSSLVSIPDDDTVVINATVVGPDCHQAYPELPEFVHQPRPEAEECLFLNIWRPSGMSSEDSLPIMVWIHGGGFMIGSGAEQVYNGSNLARDQNVLVISINYRLGALGFLPQDPYGSLAMNGLFDQTIALQWIQANAQAFGGDTEQVTVFGESSGGESVCMLSVSPLSKGLFHRAIMQSGDCVYNNWMRGVPNEDIDFALEAVDALMNATGVTSFQELQNPELVDGATINFMSAASGWTESVIVLDKEVLPMHPRELYKDASNIVPSNFLIGANSNEDLTFWGMIPEDYLQLAASGLDESVHSLVGSKYGPDVADQVVRAYDADDNYDGDTVASFSHFHGDWYIGCPSRAIATDIAQVLPSSKTVYLYWFAHFAITDPVNHFGYDDYVNTTAWASHMAEIPFLFGNMDSWIPPSSSVDNNKTTLLSAQDYEMSKEIMTRWANFAKTGTPNIMVIGGSEVELSRRSDGMEFTMWEPLSTTSQPPKVMLFVDGQGQMSTLEAKAKQCDAFPFGNDNDDDDDDDDQNELPQSGSSPSRTDADSSSSWRVLWFYGFLFLQSLSIVVL